MRTSLSADSRSLRTCPPIKEIETNIDVRNAMSIFNRKNAAAVAMAGQLMRLEMGLRAFAPDDIIMPVRKGTKYPMFPHAKEAWTWDMWKEFAVTHDTVLHEFDYCVILRDLCVIDIDDVDQARRWERSHPELTETPLIVETRRGFHYWFRRPDVADELGYYNSAGKREKGVDFKSVCSTGTSGVVMVPPSTDKRWRRGKVLATSALEHTPTLSLQLLNAVTVPVAQNRTMHLRFSNDASMDVDSRHLTHFQYFEPHTSGDLHDSVCVEDADDIIPVPCSSVVFEIMLQLALTDRFPTHVPLKDITDGLRDQVVICADMLGLGLRSRMFRRLVCGSLHRVLSAKKIDATWAADLHGRVCSPPPPAPRSISIDSEVAARLVYDPISLEKRCPDQFFFRPFSPQGRPDVGDRLLPDDPVGTMLRHCDPRVFLILREFCGRVTLAGGAVVRILLDDSPADLDFSDSDFDLFLTTTDRGEAEEVLNRMTVLWKTTPYVTRSAATFGGTQLICRLFPDVDAVLDSFDFPVCRIAFGYRRGGHGIDLWARPEWQDAVARLAFYVDIERWSPSSLYRVLKYVGKGFDVALPGLNSYAMSSNSQFGKGIPGVKKKAVTTATVSDLVDLVALMFDCGGNRPYRDDIMRFMQLGGRSRLATSNYTETMSITGRLRHVVRSMLNRIVSNQCLSPGVGTSDIQWSIYDPNRPTFRASDSKWLEAFEYPHDISSLLWHGGGTGETR